jgi:antitoxin HicB
MSDVRDHYSIRVEWSSEDEGFIATCPSFPGLSAFGETREEALEEAHIALELFIESYVEEGESLPDPQEIQRYSGQTRIRMPKSLHASLSKKAEREGVSLNTLMVSYLQRGIGYDAGLSDMRDDAIRSLQLHLRAVVQQQTGEVIKVTDTADAPEYQDRLRQILGSRQIYGEQSSGE